MGDVNDKSPMENDIVQLASSILEQCKLLQNESDKLGVAPPNLSLGSNRAFWSTTHQPLTETRSKAIGLLTSLTSLLQGPHEILHEFVGPNWDHGALYTFLQSKTLEHIAAEENGAPLENLVSKTGIPGDKLERILGLLACRGLVVEVEEGVWGLNAVSDYLAKEDNFRQWVEFQLFETRVASAHLADALMQEWNEYEDGVSGFEKGWGMDMYGWHARRPEKGDRFRRAMQGVSQSLDPADFLLGAWFDNNDRPGFKVIESGGRYGFASIALLSRTKNLTFQVYCTAQESLDRGKGQVPVASLPRISFINMSSPANIMTPDTANHVCAVVIRNKLWKWNDEGAITLLRGFLPLLEKPRKAKILIADGVSPLGGDFPPHELISYRRRDVTMMTMHNVKQRSKKEWLNLFGKVHDNIKITSKFAGSSHVYKGMWELSLE